MEKVQKAPLIVYIPVRYGQVLGVYESQEDAMQIVNVSVAKGQPCDLLVKPIIYSKVGG